MTRQADQDVSQDASRFNFARDTFTCSEVTGHDGEAHHWHPIRCSALQFTPVLTLHSDDDTAYSAVVASASPRTETAPMIWA